MKRVIAIRKTICSDFHLIIQIKFLNYICWHAMDKHDICIYKKGAKNIIWPLNILKLQCLSVCLSDKQGRAGADTCPLFSVTGQGRAGQGQTPARCFQLQGRAGQGGQGNHCGGPGDNFFLNYFHYRTYLKN